jgi:glycerol uptake facilitator-like aquaporin
VQPRAWRALAPLAELVGVALVIAVLVSARVAAWHPDSPVADRVGSTSGRVAFVAGMTGVAIVAIARSPLGRLSGAHLNPAVTVAFALRGMVAPFELVTYPVAQLAGAVLGAVAAREAWGRSADLPHVARGVAQPADGWSTAAVLGVEAAVTMALLLAAFAVLSRHSTVRVASFVVPALLAVAVCVFAPRTGAGFNPARILGPDVAAGTYPGIGSYVAAALVGSGLAAATWPLLCAGAILTPKLDHHPRYPCFFRGCRLHGAGPRHTPDGPGSW